MREVLGVNYVPSQNDIETINQQLKAFVNCLVSFHFSNSNDKARKNRDCIPFFIGSHDFLWNDELPWQNTLLLSDDIFELIKTSAVPISEHALSSFKSSIKLDLFNYFTYQNYNLYLKNINTRFYVPELHYLFGSGTSELIDFRKIFRKILNEIRKISHLKFEEMEKDNVLLLSNEESLLKKHKRRKTNVMVSPDLSIKEDTKEQLVKQYNEIDVMSALAYMHKKPAGSIRHPNAYLRDLLQNPSWFRKERVNAIELIHKLQYQQYENLPNNQRKLVFDDLVRRIKITPIAAVSENLQIYLNQLKHPGKGLIKVPNFKYCVYLYWAFLTQKTIETNNVSGENLLIALFKDLLR